MTSMNNWLGFSLSPEELPSQTHPQHHQSQESDENSGEEVSGDLTSDSTIPSPNLPAVPFEVLEAFNRNTHSQDWRSMKDFSMDPYSCSSHENQERPKLEMLLGVGSQSLSTGHHQEQKKLQNSCNIAPASTNYSQPSGHYNAYSIYQESEATSHKSTSNNNNTSGGGIGSGNNNSTSIGHSMIKSWLRNTPAPPYVDENNDICSQSNSTLPLLNANATGSCTLDNIRLNQNPVESQTEDGAVESVPKKSTETFGQRTSIYRGVTRHRWTGRYEAHLWDNSCRREGQTRKGRQVYLGGYDKEEKAGRAYDLAALKYWGNATTTNFPISNYEKEVEEMKHMTRQEYVASLRRKSSGFSRGASIYRGVTRHHQHGRWQARIGRVAGNKDLYLGTFTTQEEAAEAYDIAAIKFRGLNAVTNFEINRYDVKSILESSTLPIGAAAKHLKDAKNAEMALDLHLASEGNLNLSLKDRHINGFEGGNYHAWPTIAFHQAQPFSSMYPYAYQSNQERDTNISHGFNNIPLYFQLGNTESLLKHPSELQNFMSLESCSLGSDSVLFGSNGSFVGPMMGNQNLQGNGFAGNND